MTRKPEISSVTCTSLMLSLIEILRSYSVVMLIDAGKVTREVVDGMRREMQQVRNDPNAVFFYAFVQARAIAF